MNPIFIIIFPVLSFNVCFFFCFIAILSPQCKIIFTQFIHLTTKIPTACKVNGHIYKSKMIEPIQQFVT